MFSLTLTRKVKLSCRPFVSFLIFILVFSCFNFLFIPKISEAVTLNTSEAVSGSQSPLSQEEMKAKVANINFPFVPNFGQYNSKVRYSTQIASGAFFVTDNDLTYSFIQSEKKKDKDSKDHLLMNLSNPEEPQKTKSLALKEFFLNSKGKPISFKITPEEKTPTKISTFKGKDPRKWQSGLTTYNLLSLGELYPQIEVKLKQKNQNIEKIFYLNPGSNLKDIQINFKGINSLSVSNTGELILNTSLGQITQTKPQAYQETRNGRRTVKVTYTLTNKTIYGFEVGEYDKNLPLVIDPALGALGASTFLGGTDDDLNESIVLDNSGNVYVAGWTGSSDFPTTAGAYDESYNGNSDAFVSKFNSTLTTLSASTFFGGTDGEHYCFVALDNSGNVYVAGLTYSSDFPTTAGAYDESYNGNSDAFVSKFNSTLTTLSASTFLGGTSFEPTFPVLAVDSVNNIYIIGETHSSNFPTTAGAYDESWNGNMDVFVSKFNSTLTTLSASTFLGGTSQDSVYSFFDLDSAGNVYVAGWTGSSDFPTTAGAYDESYNGNCDGFVSKFNSNLTVLSASTFLGSATNEDNCVSLTLDSAGNVYVAGWTYSSDFPTTAGAYDESYNDGGGDVFISKFNNTLTTLSASTFLGGAVSEESGGVLVSDSAGNVYVSGFTDSSDFPTTAGAFDESYNGGGDVFISKFNNTLTTLSASTFLGGVDYEQYSFSFVLDGSGHVYVTGYTYSSDFPTTVGAYDESWNGLWLDVFVTRLFSTELVQITATVDPLFTFVISSNTCALGNVVETAVSECNYTLAVGTNAVGGATIAIQAVSDGTNAWLNLDSDPSLYFTNIPEDSTVTAGTEGYGLALTPGASWTPEGDFNDNDTPIPDTLTSILSTPGPVDTSDTSTVTHRAAISGATPAGSYSQTLEYIATGTF